MLLSERIANRGLQLQAGITRAVTRVLHDEPQIYHNDDGGATEIHRRFARPHESRWIQLRDGKPTAAGSADVVIQTDNMGVVFDRTKVSEGPIGTIVLAHNESLGEFENAS